MKRSLSAPLVTSFLLTVLTLPLMGARGRSSTPAPEPEPEPEPGPEPEPEPEQQPPAPAPEQQPPAPAPEQQPPIEPPTPIELPPFFPLPPLTWPGIPAPEIDTYPTTPEVPTEPPKPRSPAKTFKFRALHRYEVTVDALPVPGVSMQQLAVAVIPYMRMTDPDFTSTETVKRNGRDATRVRMTVSCLFDNEEPLERERSFAGVGSIWLVRAVDRGPY